MADEAALRGLLLRGLGGEDAAHRAFLMEAAALLRGFFRNRLRGSPEDAEDLVQETLVALHTRRDTYDPDYPLTAWMYAIARYRLIDHLRRLLRRGKNAPNCGSCRPIAASIVLQNELLLAPNPKMGYGTPAPPSGPGQAALIAASASKAACKRTLTCAWVRF
jgi:DNA-directed RNA polymerase specialized sigma24 family protein